MTRSRGRRGRGENSERARCESRRVTGRRVRKPIARQRPRAPSVEMRACAHRWLSGEVTELDIDGLEALEDGVSGAAVSVGLLPPRCALPTPPCALISPRAPVLAARRAATAERGVAGGGAERPPCMGQPDGRQSGEMGASGRRWRGVVESGRSGTRAARVFFYRVSISRCACGCVAVALSSFVGPIQMRASFFICARSM